MSGEDVKYLTTIPPPVVQDYTTTVGMGGPETTLPAFPSALPSADRLPGPELVAKVCAVILKVKPIQKKGWNQEFGYSYARAEDIAEALRGPLAEQGLLFLPIPTELTTDEIESSSGKKRYRTVVEVHYLVTDGKTALMIPFRGEGHDSGDKSISKAYTAADKAASRAIFHLPIGDDPEAGSMPQGARTRPRTTAQEPAKTAQDAPRGDKHAKGTVRFGKYEGMTLTELKDQELRTHLEYAKDHVNDAKKATFKEENQAYVRELEAEIERRKAESGP